jgi:putative transposase
MPNHLHVVLVPQDEDGLRRTFGDLYRRYTGYINARMRTTGHLWQGWFSSVAMDEAHLVSALRYVALNPVRARLVKRAIDWKWSSTRALCDAADDGSSLLRLPWSVSETLPLFWARTLTRL